MPPPLKVALITGAGSGIGRAIALRLARAGYSLALVGRTHETLQQTLQQTQHDAERASQQGTLNQSANLAAQAIAQRAPHHIITADLRDPEAAGACVDAALAHFGRLDVLVNNAGWSAPATIPQTTPDLARDVFLLNAVAPCVTIARAWPTFELQRAGTIVNISSLATSDPFPTLYAYGAAKASVEHLTLSAHKQGAALGIRAFAIAPGAVETKLLRAIVPTAQLPQSATLAPDDIAREIESCIRGERDQLAGTVIRLASPRTANAK